jgi:hypothetical protein
MGAPSSNPPAKPTVHALSRSLILTSSDLADSLESFEIRPDCADAGFAITATAINKMTTALARMLMNCFLTEKSYFKKPL